MLRVGCSGAPVLVPKVFLRFLSYLGATSALSWSLSRAWGPAVAWRDPGSHYVCSPAWVYRPQQM